MTHPRLKMLADLNPAFNANAIDPEVLRILTAPMPARLVRLAPTYDDYAREAKALGVHQFDSFAWLRGVLPAADTRVTSRTQVISRMGFGGGR